VADGKILSVEQAEAAVHGARHAGQTVVLCLGCFDIVHPGHVRHLQHAARLGDRLLVAVTADAMVDKGTGRPLIPQELRAENLAALDCVDWVAIDPGPEPVDLLRRLRPDVYVKGREYEGNRDPRFAAERRVVEECGGRVVFSSGDVVFSSSALIAALEQSLDPVRQAIRQLLEKEGLDAAGTDLLVESFRGRSVLVIGETIKDTYVMCDRPEVAGEAPIMTLRPVEWRSFDGGAAIIGLHLAAMGARPVLLTALPASAEAEAIRRRLEERGVEVCALRCQGALVEKQRFLVGSAKVLKLDLGGPLTLAASQQEEFVRGAAGASARCEAAILADYGQGLFTPATMNALCRAVRPRMDLLVGDVSGRRSNLLAMRQVDMLCPTEGEIRAALHDYDEGLSAVVWKLLHMTGSRSALVKMGAEGATAFDCPPEAMLRPEDWRTRLSAQHVPALCPHAVDELGCGDAFLAAAVLARAGGASLAMAALVGSVAAAAQSQRLGNAVIGAVELRRSLRRLWRGEPSPEASLEVAVVSGSGDQLRLAHA
jgi:rfaE bifunctional protein nucleotidyltransferase chain/domain